MAALVQQALKHAPDLPEWCELGVVEKMGWPVWREALTASR
jgi:ATP-dependent DNA helicase RecG